MNSFAPQILFGLFLLASMLLPIADYGPHAADPDAYADVMSTALPDGTWFNRAVASSLLLLIGWGTVVGLSWHQRLPLRWRDARPSWLDGPMLAWVLTPAVSGLFRDSPLSADLWQTCYLAVTWGVPYVVGRLSFTRAEQVVGTFRLVLWVGAATFVVALSEFVLGRFLYHWLYGEHPFQLQGAERYFGFRPLLLFEDANQIAMWWMTVALCAMGLIRLRHGQDSARWWPYWGVVPVFLFQGVGGMLLTIAGGLLIWVRSRRALLGFALALGIAGCVGYSVRGPLLSWGRSFGDSSPIGSEIKQLLKQAGLDSLSWRIGLEERNHAIMRQSPWFGWGSIRFWEASPHVEHPWGFASLVLGAYGLFGLLGWLSLGVPLVWFSSRRERQGNPLRGQVLYLLAVIWSCHVLDAVFNSAFLLPTVMWLGGATSIALRAGEGDDS